MIREGRHPEDAIIPQFREDFLAFLILPLIGNDISHLEGRRNMDDEHLRAQICHGNPEAQRQRFEGAAGGSDGGSLDVAKGSFVDSVILV